MPEGLEEDPPVAEDEEPLVARAIAHRGHPLSRAPVCVEGEVAEVPFGREHGVEGGETSAGSLQGSRVGQGRIESHGSSRIGGPTIPIESSNSSNSIERGGSEGRAPKPRVPRSVRNGLERWGRPDRGRGAHGHVRWRTFCVRYRTCFRVCHRTPGVRQRTCPRHHPASRLAQTFGDSSDPRALEASGARRVTRALPVQLLINWPGINLTMAPWCRPSGHRCSSLTCVAPADS